MKKRLNLESDSELTRMGVYRWFGGCPPVYHNREKAHKTAR